MLDYYNKKPQFYGSIDEDWPRRIRQFESICDAYRVYTTDKAKLFSHSLTSSSAAHQTLEELLDQGIKD